MFAENESETVSDRMLICVNCLGGFQDFRIDLSGRTFVAFEARQEDRPKPCPPQPAEQGVWYGAVHCKGHGMKMKGNRPPRIREEGVDNYYSTVLYLQRKIWRYLTVWHF